MPSAAKNYDRTLLNVSIAWVASNFELYTTILFNVMDSDQPLAKLAILDRSGIQIRRSYGRHMDGRQEGDEGKLESSFIFAQGVQKRSPRVTFGQWLTRLSCRQRSARTRQKIREKQQATNLTPKEEYRGRVTQTDISRSIRTWSSIAGEDVLKAISHVVGLLQ